MLSLQVFNTVQGGRDISGTLSKLHCRIEKHFFIYSFMLQTVSAVCRSINKNNNTHSSKVDEPKESIPPANVHVALRAGTSNRVVVLARQAT
jgi:hypothetical protein